MIDIRALLLLAGVGAACAATVIAAGPARADHDPTPEVCGAFNLGVPPDQIAQGLERGDGRYNYWRAQQSTIWPIIEGQCED
jgi:hypothetical protein